MVRRSFTFKQEETDFESSVIAAAGGNVSFGSAGVYKTADRTSISLKKHTLKDVWFSGAYTYHLPTDDGLIGRLERYEAEADRLLGIELTPAVLWELTPWSWLVDWLFDIGNLFQTSTLLSSDGLGLKYGYLMCHTRETHTYSWQKGIQFINGTSSGPIYNTLRRETKERVKATPYGFGSAVTGFTSHQWAILGALGLTKAPNVLF